MSYFVEYWNLILEGEEVHLFVSKFLRKSLPLAVCAAVLSGCSINSDHPMVAEEERFAEYDYNYVIGPGDDVQIFVWGNDDLSVTVPVRPDGKITTRLAEDLQASGRTSTELAREIEEVYSQYIKNPIVTVIIDEFVTIPDQQIRVVGDGVSPTGVPYSKHMTLLDVMILVGGLNEFADGDAAKLIRMVDGEQQTYSLRLDSLLNEGDIAANMAMKPGDIVVIPEAWF
ncbi:MULTISPECIES: XrtA/PEP-CTERM system exopolysaccharide export protein [Neptunomonas]|uniref:XrtA/PEP-CTERM system exopolysaccharide export protein n=1 Tax=Neptunomonas TaxID=75687 RepID=UPI001980AF00|nr:MULTISPECIES: XrtA/PEP-CTERM system exopolysaccharide export protein [Neptunomonas]